MRHQKANSASRVPGSRATMVVWTAKNTPAISNPPPATQVPRVRRSAFSRTANPSHRKAMVLNSDSARIAQLKRSSSTSQPLRAMRISLQIVRRPLAAGVEDVRRAELVPHDQTPLSHDE